MTTPAPGWYWVRDAGSAQWIVARYAVGRWWTLSTTTAATPPTEIGPRLEPPA